MEVTSEFGLMQTHGRTMEPAGSSCIAWDPDRIQATIGKIRDRLPGIDPSLEDLCDDAIRLWIYGFLHRARIRGAIAHPYLESFAKNNFWGEYPIAGNDSGPRDVSGGPGTTSRISW
ncbi:MAG UNVERIFIED_CONTAM: hypothetical protein LVT10_03015 [Anaerolineae bacterium]